MAIGKIYYTVKLIHMALEEVCPDYSDKVMFKKRKKIAKNLFLILRIKDV